MTDGVTIHRETVKLNFTPEQLLAEDIDSLKQRYFEHCIKNGLIPWPEAPNLAMRISDNMIVVSIYGNVHKP